MVTLLLAFAAVIACALGLRALRRNNLALHPYPYFPPGAREDPQLDLVQREMLRARVRH